jgi:transcriptional regulator with XRE-family HTH domain
MARAPDAQMRDAVALAIRALRAERGWTQRELCRHTELSPAYLSELEAGHKDASAEVLNRLANAFGVRSDQFLWIIMLGMLHGEIPGVERRNAALDVAQRILEMRPAEREEVLQFLGFLQWRGAGKPGRARNKRQREFVDDTEEIKPDMTED